MGVELLEENRNQTSTRPVVPGKHMDEEIVKDLLGDFPSDCFLLWFITERIGETERRIGHKLIFIRPNCFLIFLEKPSKAFSIGFS